MKFLEKFELYMERLDLSQNTITNTLADIKNFCDFIGVDHNKLTKRRTENITKEEIEKYINYLRRNYKSSTALRRKSSLKKLLKYIESNKMDFLSDELKIKKTTPDTYFPTDEEVETLFNDIMENGNPIQKCVMMIIKNTGMRIGEVQNLNIDNIDFNKDTITVIDTKNHKDRKLPVNHNLINYIKDYIESDRTELKEKFRLRDGNALITSRNGRRHTDLLKLMKPFYDKYGFTTHGVRKQVSTRIYKITGYDAKTTSYFMGNSPEVLLNHYIKVDKDKYDSIRNNI